MAEAGWIVFKLGGSIEGASVDSLVQGLRLAMANGLRPLLVHGGGPRISRALAEAGIEASFVAGQRVTSPAAMVIVERVLAREINVELVAALQAHDVPAVGLSGADGVLVARVQPGLERTGVVDHVLTGPVVAVKEAGCVPVLAPVGRGTDGGLLNINADLATAAVAGALHAERVIFFTDVPGIYANWSEKRLMYGGWSDELAALHAGGSFTGGMIPKVEAVLAATAAGVPAAIVVDGRDPQAVAWAVECDVAVGSPDAPWRSPRPVGGTIIVRRPERSVPES
ncbi:MAG: acetylglutamate kinase [Alicyclobacillus sp.]|nr:acetylglutamate kinase [Alicyclobacillus sp.]